MAFDGKSEHYCAGGMEAMDVIEAYGLNFAIGNAVKYLLRCGRKGDDADALRDLEKAAAYIQREIKRRSAEKKRGRVVRLATNEERQRADDLDGLAKREAQE